MFNLFPKFLNIVIQEIMSDPDKLIKVIVHYQQALEHYAKKKNDAKMLHCIFKLSHMPITRKHLEHTGVGRTVNSLRRLDEVGDAARSLVAKWKDMVSKQEEEEEDDDEDDDDDEDEDDDDDDEEEEIENIKSVTSKDVNKKSTQRHKTDDNKSNSSQRHSDKSNDRGERLSNHKQEKHKEKSHSSKKNHISSSQKDLKERRQSYERHSEDDNSEGFHLDQKEQDSITKDNNISDSERSVSNESVEDRITSDYENESDSEENLKTKHSKNKKTESKETKKYSESSSKDKQLSSSNYSERKSHKSSRRDRSNSKERRHSKSKEQPRDKSKEKKMKEDKNKGPKKEVAKRKRQDSDSSDSEHLHKNHSSKHNRYYDEDENIGSGSSRQIHMKEISDDDIQSSSLRKDTNKKHYTKKEKEKKESYRSTSHHSSSKSESKHSEKTNRKKDKSSKESEKKSDKKGSKHESKSKSKPVRDDILKTENGICSSFGASFAEALGMLEPTTSKGVKKGKPHTMTSSTPEKLKSEKSPDKNNHQPNSTQPLKVDVTLPSLPAKLEPIDIDISSLLPTITPNYRPLGNYMENSHNSRNKILNDDEALSMVMSSKNQRTKVYSGNKTMWNSVPTLFELCTRILQDNIDALEYTGGVPYCILKPVLDKATPDQLFVMEHHNPYLMEDTDELWQLHCQREFRNKQREEMETWREMYMRCLDEREAKLKTLKANIKESQQKSVPVRKTQLAYIDSVVKPPRNILKKQMKTSTDKRPAITPASRLTALATSGAAGQIVVPNPGSRASSSGRSSSALIKPKKAPLMQKTLQFLKGGRFRR